MKILQSAVIVNIPLITANVFAHFVVKQYIVNVLVGMQLLVARFNIKKRD